MQLTLVSPELEEEKVKGREIPKPFNFALNAQGPQSTPLVIDHER